jgi:cytochrome c biogenesis protein CcmG/thiol:disulfide interchange protein DsbE
VTLGPARLSPAPDFTLKSLTGESVKLSDFRGKVVLLNFWATWVGPCRILTPWLVELQSQYGPHGLQVVGVSLDDDATKVEIGEFADTLRVNYPILMGDEKVANAYGGIPAMPVTFVVGRDGKTVDRIIGLKGKGEIEDVIKKTLDPKEDDTPSSPTPGPAPLAQK